MSYDIRNLRLGAVALLPTVLLAVGCGGGSKQTTTTPNPAPAVTSLSPAKLLLGTASQTLTITGTNFISSSSVTYNGTSHASTYVSATQLTLSLAATDVSAAGEFPVVVANPTPGGGSSAATNFEVDNPAPAVTSLSPAKLLLGTASQTLTITGTNFISSSSVTYNGTSHAATYVSATQLTLSLAATDVSAAGEFPVVVANPTPGGGSSAATNFEVDNPAPVVTALNPATIPAGSAATTLTVTGTGFLSTSTVTFNGTAATPTVVSSTEITIPLAAAELVSAGNPSVVVSNPAPGGGSSSALALAITAPGPVVAGAVYRGLNTTGATISAYTINTDGTSNTTTPLGTTTQNADGSFSLQLTAAPTGALRLTATGGTYNSPVDGTTAITATGPLSLVLDSVTANVSGVTITPISDFVSSVYTGQLSGAPVAATRKSRRKVRPAAVPSPGTAHQSADALILSFFGLTSTDVPEALPVSFLAADVTANPDWFKAGMVIGGMVQEALTSTPGSLDDIFAALSLDIEDGVFDGLTLTGTQVTFASGAKANLPFTAGTSDFLLGLGSFSTTSAYLQSIGVTGPEIASLESTIFAGVYSSPATPSSAGLLAGNSGAVATYTVGGKQYLILAALSEGVVVIDITDPNAATPTVKAWTGIPAAAFSGADVGGVVTYTALGGHPEVLAFAYQSTTVAFLNLTTLINGDPAMDNPIDSTLALAIQNGPASFSGGAAYIAGGIAGGNTVYLDTSDGYYSFDLATSTLGKLYTVEDPTQAVAENFGGDIQDGILLAGNYGGLQYVDLNKQMSYYTSGADLLTLFPGFYQGELVDGDSVDSGFHVGIMNSEHDPSPGFVNLSGVTETNSTGTGVLNTLTIPAQNAAQVTLGSLDISGSAVDSTTHLVFFAGDYTTDIAVGSLQDPASVAAGSVYTGLNDWRYYNVSQSPELANFGTTADPHSLGVVLNNSNGKSYAYELDGNGYKGVMQVDMAGFLALADANDGTPDAHVIAPTVDPAAAGGPLREITWP